MLYENCQKKCLLELLIILLYVFPSEPCRSSTSKPTDTAATVASPRCTLISDNVTAPCKILNLTDLGYNQTVPEALEFLRIQTDKWLPYKLCNVSKDLPVGSCNCSKKLVELAWRLYLPECVNIYEKTTPCNSYCMELINR